MKLIFPNFFLFFNVILQEKRFHNWLENARDWAVSRSRFWGTPLPIWTSEDGEECIVMDSIDKLERLSGVKVYFRLLLFLFECFFLTLWVLFGMINIFENFPCRPNGNYKEDRFPQKSNKLRAPKPLFNH